MTNEFFEQLHADPDELTRIFRRDAIMFYAEHLIEQNVPFTFAILDIDNFKLVNDNYGHQMGDEVLKIVAKSLQKETDGKGFVGRYGGDEFIFVFPYLVDYDTVWKILFRVLKSGTRLEFSESSINISYTMGCSRFPENTTNIDELFTLADKALYRGKVKGRNCFIIYLPEKHANIALQTFREKVYSPIHLHAKIFNILTNEKRSVDENIKQAIDFVGPYLLIDHLCIEDKDGLRHEYFQPLFKDRVYAPFGVESVVEYVSDNGVFYENTVIGSKHLESKLYKSFVEQGIYAEFICILRAYGKVFGILRADMVSVDTGRIWQNEDLVLLENLANIMSMALYIDSLKK
ncbi:MAG: GGDEF domain-containing protein [Acholeplasmatales bacterium]|nr:GGDEF domain-containing protein [Acholeplasmatales bacterium]